MNVAMLTCTRDRLDYTQHCYQTLVENAGCDFDWYVVDQASQDGTLEWLWGTDATVIPLEENIGICRALNLMLDTAFDPDDYDVIVRWDNDCELTQPGTLRVVCEASMDHGWILAPTVLGLRNPPGAAPAALLGPHLVAETQILGGVFMAIPSELFHVVRYDETHPKWGGDEAICPWYRRQGGHCGYMVEWTVNHYETTDGQWDRYPDYFARVLAEGKPPG